MGGASTCPGPGGMSDFGMAGRLGTPARHAAVTLAEQLHAQPLLVPFRIDRDPQGRPRLNASGRP